MASSFGPAGGVAFILGLTAPAGVLAAWTAYEVRVILHRRQVAAARGA